MVFIDMRVAILLAFAGLLAYAQETRKLEFEVASIKPAEPQIAGRGMIGMSGGPGTRDPGQITYRNVPVRMLLLSAFDIKGFQLTAPASVDDLRFDILVKVPKGATKEDSRVMLQNLLADRFGMKVHHESKEMQAFALVPAKGGVKLRPSAEPPANADPAAPGGFAGPPGPPKLDKNGFPTFPAGGRGLMMMFSNGQMHGTGAQETIGQICDFISNQLGRPVVDQTGLNGKYDFNLEFAPENMPGLFPGAGPGPGRGDAASPPPSSDPAPTLIGALQEQLGLKLEAKKLAIDIVVLDHIEKTPTEN
jgi:uncharacterized protein (TIGR03435 family)